MSWKSFTAHEKKTFTLNKEKWDFRMLAVTMALLDSSPGVSCQFANGFVSIFASILVTQRRDPNFYRDLIVSDFCSQQIFNKWKIII